MIVTIDGPAGAGKSTAARHLAQRLGFRFLDTGAMYRAVTLACLNQEIDLEDEEAIAVVCRNVDIQFRETGVFLGGDDVTQLIRTQRVTEFAPVIARNSQVRAHLVELQQKIGAAANIVTEGRDQGTVVFPHAGCKFFLTADPVARAERRFKDLERQGEQTSLEQIAAQQSARDESDSAREVGPLKPADDALLIDTSALNRDEVLDTLEKIVRDRMAK